MRSLASVGWLLFASAAALAQTPERLWETQAVFSGPESVAYDSNRDVLYVSNFRPGAANDRFYGNDFISRVSLSGEVLDLHWVDGLTEPTGICLHDGKLYVVERFGVVVIDPGTASIAKRIRIPTTGFLNDVTVSDEGIIFVSDSSSDTVYAVEDDSVYSWFAGPETARTNGLLATREHLLVAANADSALRAVRFDDLSATTLAHLPPGILDGIKPFGEEDLLVSAFEGVLYRVSGSGGVEVLLNTSASGMHIADFEFIPEKNLLVVPTLWNNKIVAYRLETPH